MSKPKVGEKAPNFEGLDQNGNSIKLSDYQGKKIVLYFYPADNTPGCTAQACNLRDNEMALKKAGYEVIGVSKDSQKKHQNFIKKYELPFPLIADTELEVIKAYGCWGPKKFMGREFDGILRTTFLIDEKGTIEQVIEKVKTKAHFEQFEV